jgi:POT family proton-dependent oligopeptide transporter
MIKLDRKLMLTFSFLEMWERFGFYGMRALLTLFLIKHFGFSDTEAYSVYSLYAAICYIIPLLAGFLADKVFGYKKLLLFGAVVICIGQACLSFALSSTSVFYLGLACVAVGTGFFKGNVTNMLGAVYSDKNSKERDYGFRVFYIMVNVGATISSVACGAIAEAYGWEYGFGLAGIGMLIGLVALILSSELLKDHGNPPQKQSNHPKLLACLELGSVSAVGSLLLIGVCVMAFFYVEASIKAISIAGVLIVLHFLYIMSRCNKKERMGLIFICIMLVFFTLMFALEMQLGAFVNVFTDRHVERTLFGLEVPAASLQSLNPFTIIVLGGLANVLLKRLGHQTLKVFGGGLVMMCLSFMTLYVGCLYYDQANFKTNIIFLVISMVFMAFSELMMAPIMQSFITYIAPARMRGYMMGFLMLCLTYANLVGPLISKYMLQIENKGTEADSLNSLVVYQECFFKIGIMFIVASIVYFAIYKFLKKVYVSYN